jgi:hypothetical protein
MSSQTKQVGTRGKILALIVIIAGISGIVAYSKLSPIVPYDEPRPSGTNEDAMIAKAANVAIKLKGAMRDPDSFRLSSVLVIYPTNAICYEYRARNGFGGMDVGEAVLSPKGIFRANEMDGFHALWRSECSGRRGREEVDAVTFLLNHPTS